LSENERRKERRAFVVEECSLYECRNHRRSGRLERTFFRAFESEFSLQEVFSGDSKPMPSSVASTSATTRQTSLRLVAWPPWCIRRNNGKKIAEEAPKFSGASFLFCHPQKRAHKARDKNGPKLAPLWQKRGRLSVTDKASFFCCNRRTTMMRDSTADATETGR